MKIKYTDIQFSPIFFSKKRIILSSGPCLMVVLLPCWRKNKCPALTVHNYMNHAIQILAGCGEVSKMLVNTQKIYTKSMWIMNGLQVYIVPLGPTWSPMVSIPHKKLHGIQCNFIQNTISAKLPNHHHLEYRNNALRYYVVFCFASVLVNIVHMLHGHSITSREIIWFPQCSWSNLAIYLGTSYKSY